MFFECIIVRRQLIIALCVYVGQILAGYTTGWTAPLIPKLQDPELSPLPGPITDFQVALIGTIIYLGGLAGPYLTGYLADVKGRKSCMLLGGVCSTIAYLILATAKTLVVIYIGRFLSGFGVGIVMVMALVYLGEVASTNVRGVLLSGIGIFMTAGGLIAFSVGPFVSYAMSGYVGAVIAFIYTLTIFWIPETPTYYALKDDKIAVEKVLENLGRSNEIDKILSPRKEENSWEDWKQLFLCKGNRKALGITIVLNITQNGSGIVAITFFATSIFELAGANIEPAFGTIILGLTQLCGGLITPVFVERSGRRKLLLISMGICCLSMLVLGVYFYLYNIDHWVAQNLRWLPLTTLMIFYVGYDLGLGILPNAIAGEMFDPNVRSKGCGVAISISWVIGFAITTAFGSLIMVLGGHIMFWFFSAICASGFIFTIFFVPETAGKSLKEIQEMLNK